MSNIKKGFTLIEMLIVVVIIGILAAALIPRLQNVQGRARDTKRKADLSQIGTASAIYKNDNGGYSGLNIKNLASGGYMTAVPVDNNIQGALSEFGADANTTTGGGYAARIYCNGYQCLILGAFTEVAGSSNATSGDVSSLTATSATTIASGQALILYPSGGAPANSSAAAIRYYYVQ